MTDGAFKPIPQSAAENTERSRLSTYESYLLSAGQMVAEGRYQEAIRSLQDPQIPRRFGLDIKEGNTFGINSTSEEELRHLLASISIRSWFHIETREIEVPDVLVHEGVEVPAGFWHDLALIHLEEWLHGMQTLNRGSLTGYEDSHDDIAAYFLIHGIPMTNRYVEFGGLQAFVAAKST